MKVILIGSTGFVGREVFRQCLENPSITSIVALPVVHDFLTYSEVVLNDIKGAEARIWTLGKAIISNIKMSRKLHIGYTLAAVKAFSQVLASKVENARKFRFIYCSCGASMKVEVENQLIAYCQCDSDTIETYMLRPAIVLSREMSIRSLLSGLGPSIKVDVVAGVMVDVTLHRYGEQISENTMSK
ncbi:hypothetical protein BDV29DRAFT_200085 [Aspergillus leporis]|uniref:NAD(P)-binding domain-containing protein n=1 Tax=Aspergillus leporis TaxID=41062 RepID=A0A5N5WGQ5_9EURO|nr:hypothetical protein BDV29DRAFT_200085 [Aspergillus leporis]